MSRVTRINERRGSRTKWRAAVAAAALLVAAAAHATTYDESTMGDLSGLSDRPTVLHDPLTPGANRIVGTTGPTGGVLDFDYVSFTVPTGDRLAQIGLGPQTGIASGDRMFFAIAAGVGVYLANPDIFDPADWSAQGLLGWTLVDPSMVGTDVLPDLGASAPANFPPVVGATGFSGALPAGNYTLWMLDGDSTARYDLDVVVTRVPEPSTWALMAIGVGLVFVERRRRASSRGDDRSPMSPPVGC